MAKKKSTKPASSAGAATYGENTSLAPADTRAAAEAKGESAKFWLDELKAADKREDKWRKRGKKVVERYRDEREKDGSADRRTNILWSNTELLKGVLFQNVGNPDVRRRFPKKGKDERAARQAALVLERSLGYCKDAYDLESQIECAVEDHLLPGRGVGWIVYDADLEYVDDSEAPDAIDANAPEDGEPEATGIADQEVRFEHVFWEDYRTSAGRKEADIWWKSRRHQYTRDELKKYFAAHAAKIPLNAEVADSPSTNKDDNETFKRANVWEIWDKTKKQRVYIAEDYSLLLKKDDDPYKLKDFFPCPPALYGVKTTSSLVPVPEYTLYQDQCEELDRIATRLSRQIESLKRRGVYDAGAEGADNQLSQLANAGDDEFFPYKGFAGLMEKGGLKAVFQVEDMVPATVVIDKLSMREAQLVQKIYEITGISDIFRGASDPNETATAQRIKGQVGGLRIEKRKGRVQHFIRDTFRLKAEIIAEHFTREKLVEMTGIDMPLQMEIDQAKQALDQLQKMQQAQAQQAQMAQQQAAQAQQQQAPGQPGMGHNMPPPGMQQAPAPVAQQPPMPMPSPEQVSQWQTTAKAVSWEEISAILRSDQRRGYKVDIETTDTNGIDDQEEKQSRIEFMTTMQGMIEKSVPMMMQVPALIPLMKENAMFVAKAFKAGRTQEESFEEAFDALQMQAQQAAKQGPPPNPEMAKVELEKQKLAQTAQSEQARMAAEAQFKQNDLIHQQQLETAKLQAQRAADQEKLVHAKEIKAMELEHAERIEGAKLQASHQLEHAKMRNATQLEQQKLHHQKLGEDAKAGMQKEQFDQQMQFNWDKAQLDSAGDMDGEGGETDGAAPKKGKRVVKVVRDLQVALADQTKAAQEMSAVIEELKAERSAPRKFLRDPKTNRAVGVMVGNRRYDVERDPSGRAVGLQVMNDAA
jgi:hypothetical protein